MIKPPLPKNESQRLNALYSLNTLNTSPEERFDRITRLAKKLFEVPVALVSLIDLDRQWFKSADGLNMTETPRDISFCGHAILSDEILIVEDATKDARFWDNPFVLNHPFIRFYLGCPLKIDNEYNVGTLCLIDRKPRSRCSVDLEILRDFADMVQEDLKSTHLYSTDELTSLTNRRGFIAIANHVFNLSVREQKPMVLLYFDLNDFKKINDTYGHSEGDRILKVFAGELLKSFRCSDVIARLGGDEFCVLCTGIKKENILNLLKRFEDMVLKGNQHGIQYSVGCIEYDKNRHSGIHDLLKDGDSEMYQDKKEHKPM